MEIFCFEGEIVENLINWIPLAITTILGVFNVYILWKKARPEIKKIESESASEYAAAAKASADAVKLYTDELTGVRAELKELRKELDAKDAIITARDKVIMEQKTTIDDLKDWAERLTYQVKSRGEIPVPFRSPRKLGKI